MTDYAMTTDSDERKEIPLAEGVLYYFGPALVEMAKLSKVGNDKHNPDQPLHWSREKSNDHADCIMRHLLDAGTDDTDGVPHSVKVAWRACALATEDLIARKGYKAPKNARTADTHGRPKKPELAGWIHHHSDVNAERPTGADDLIQIRRADNEVIEGRAGGFSWDVHPTQPWRIIAWRLAPK